MREEHVETPRAEIESSAPPVEEGAPLWTTTFGDMMSLLLTFFILLFSMSELKMERFVLANQSLREAMGSTAVDPVDDPMGLLPDPVDPDQPLANPGKTDGATDSPVDADATEVDWLETFTDAYLEMIAKRLEAFVEENGLQDRVRVERAGEGVYLRIETVVLFDTGEASVNRPGEEILTYLTRITADLDVPVAVSGHADSVPIRTAQFPSNWELSAARAAGVARVLVAGGQSPERVKVQSFGQYRPVADNGTPEGRARNRRVELFFSRDDIRAAARIWAIESGALDPSAVPDGSEAAGGQGGAVPEEGATMEPAAGSRVDG